MSGGVIGRDDSDEVERQNGHGMERGNYYLNKVNGLLSGVRTRESKDPEITRLEKRTMYGVRVGFLPRESFGKDWRT